MARLPRYMIPGQPQHIIQRGNNRQAIFACDEDYRFFGDALVEASAKHDLAIHAYVWMTNHVHLLATPGAQDSISKVFQSVGRKYVQYFNFNYKRSGTLWEGRYRATVVDSERYLLTVMHSKCLSGRWRLICTRSLANCELRLRLEVDHYRGLKYRNILPRQADLGSIF